MNVVGGSDARPLAGCRVAVTRERAGALGRLLAERGAVVVHVPLIDVVDAEDGGRALREALADTDRFDWVLVTSAPGAERVAAALDDRWRSVQIGCVGSATARRWGELTGRPADLIPERQLAASLAESFLARHDGAPPQRVVVAQADRAQPDLVDALTRGGHRVQVVTAYRTLTRRPNESELAELQRVDAVLFASGSAAAGWADALGADARSLLPPIAVAIGPSTAASAEEIGLKISHVAADHSVPGLVDELVAARHDRRDR